MVIIDWVNGVLGVGHDSLAVWQMALRALVVYPFGLVVVRLGEKRFIGKFTAFDVVMGVIIGTMLGSAITRPGGFWGTLAAIAVLVGMHTLLAVLGFHSDRIAAVVKGSPASLVIDGRIQWDAMRRTHITQKELESALRENAGTDDISRVRHARLERSGNVSAIMKDDTGG